MDFPKSQVSQAPGRRGHSCALALVIFVAICWAPGANAWEIVKHGGRDYVTVSDMKRFYGFEKADFSRSRVYLDNRVYQVRAWVGQQDFYINKIRFILSYPIVREGGKILISRIDLCKLIDPVLRPHFIRKSTPFNTVILDPGHGGQDSGTVGRYGKEKEFNLRLAQILSRELKSLGFIVKMTRDSDRRLSLEQRVRIANGIPRAIFISLHFNSGHRSASGVETFALSPQGSSSTYTDRHMNDFKNFKGNIRDAENIALATAVHASVVHSLKSKDRGVKRARFAVLRGINKPAILLEGGFLSNAYEAQKIRTDSHLTKLAKAVAKAVGKYQRSVGAKR